MTAPRIRVVHLSVETLAALAAGDLAAAAASAPVPLTPWLVSSETIGTWRRRASQVVDAPDDLGWVTGVIWDEDREETVGVVGFHAAPDPDGRVEIGYGVDPSRRRRGYARAALAALVARARAEPDVHVVRLTISPDNIPSHGVMRDHPFVEVGKQWDEEDGLETIYEMPV